MMLDVERMLAETAKYDDELSSRPSDRSARQDLTVVFADDSSVARGQIERTLQGDGRSRTWRDQWRAAWDELQKIANYAEVVRTPVKDFVQLMLTDVEMPEMDGYILTKNIKSDPRFVGIPVIMHSSLSSTSNQQLGKSVGVDEYVPKFEAQRLAETLTPPAAEGRAGTRRRPDARRHRAMTRHIADGTPIPGIVDRERRCAHQAGGLQPDGDPAVLARHPRDCSASTCSRCARSARRRRSPRHPTCPPASKA